MAAAKGNQVMAETINEDTVRHIATLSRLKLSDEEVQEFTEELTAILSYINQLEEVDVTNVEPTAHAIAVSNVLRADEIKPSLAQEKALANAPAREGSFFKVPKVLDQDTV